MSLSDYPISWLVTPTLLIAALLLDVCLGEPRRWHPLAGFGTLAQTLERRLNLGFSPIPARMLGLLAWLGLLLPFFTLAWALCQLKHGWIVHLLLLYFAIGARSLKEHALAIYDALLHKDVPAARHAVGMIVSRDTEALNEQEIATASVESVLENGNDAIFAALFWFVLLGGPGALLFRLANTLDAMWGYRTPRFLHFGWAAARLDDLLNLIPARLTAFSYALSGHTRVALQCWYIQGREWYSPNAGPVMAAGAGALMVNLGGAARYHGAIKQRPSLGTGPKPEAATILAAVKLVNRSLYIWASVVLLVTLLAVVIAGLLYGLLPGLFYGLFNGLLHA